MASSVVSSYLRGYADPLIGALPALSRPLHHIICIPLCDEDSRFLETLESLTQVEGTAAVSYTHLTLPTIPLV